MSSSLVQLGRALGWVVNLYCWILVIRVLLTWFRPNPDAPFVKFLAKLADPALDFARRRLPLRLGGLDFSPVLLLVLLSVLSHLIRTSTAWLGLGGPAVGLLGLLAIALVQAVRMLAWLFILLMIGRVVISLVKPSSYNPVVMVVMALTESLLVPLRGVFPAKGPGGVDSRALVALVVLLVLYYVVLDNLVPPIAQWLSGLRQGPMVPQAPPPVREPRIW